MVDEGKNCVSVFTTPRYETKTDIRKEMGRLSLSFFYVFPELSISGTQKKIDDDDRRGNMRQHRLRIEVNDNGERWIYRYVRDEKCSSLSFASSFVNWATYI
jgi:hypothetical protein